MRELFPAIRATGDPAQWYLDDARTPRGIAPWVVSNMIASVDGATAINGRSASLGSEADRRIFLCLRSCADVILVGAGTARTENYHPPELPPDLTEKRSERSQTRLPRIAVVSRRLEIDPTSALFGGDGPPPLVITSADAEAEKVDALRHAADVIQAGTATVDLPAALVALRRDHGADVVLCEGGPTLNGALADARAIDELCISVAPMLVGGTSDRIIRGADTPMTQIVLDRVLEEGGYLFLRYLTDWTR